MLGKEINQVQIQVQVIIVSNRLPISVKRINGKLDYQTSLGGLASGLSSLYKDKDNLWVGWPGIASDSLSENEKAEIVDELAKSNCLPIFLNQKQIDNFYNGYSNSILWPIFHGLPPDDPDPKWYKDYENVNKTFAEVINNISLLNSEVWVHDYHFMLLPRLIRKINPNINIGFFLHIPFPDSDSLSKIDERKELVNGLLGSNLIGFHTANYTNEFKLAVQAQGYEVVNDTISLKNRSVKLGDFPISIDYQKYALAHTEKGVKQEIRSLKKQYKNKKIIVSVDRLDPTKGLEEKLLAYQEFLKRNPKLVSKVVFIMVAAPSREEVKAYKALEARLEVLNKRINKKYSQDHPLVYIHEAVNFVKINALYAIASVAFITPIRDGMNLVAKEFIASNRKGGVLILSSTAGAATELSDALIVNPLNKEEVVSALESSLSMSVREIRSRLKNMKQYVSGHTISDWSNSFMKNLNDSLPKSSRLTRSLNKKIKSQLIKDYKLSNKRLILLDYYGTLTPVKNRHSVSKPDTKLIHLIKALSSDSSNSVVLISGRSKQDLNQWFGELNVGLVAENGAEIKRSGKSAWKTITYIDDEWQDEILFILNKYTSLTPKSKIEIKPHSLVWHYKNSPPYYANKYVVIIKRILKPVASRYGITVSQGNKTIEIKNNKINKGEIIKDFLKIRHDFILAIGDDHSDEDMFSELPPEAYTIKVGRGLTKAKYRLEDYSKVLSLLRKLA